MKTRVYIDGFNLYYGCCKGTSNKWLNPSLLCQKLLGGNHEIDKIWYFSAEVKQRAGDGDVVGRQQRYLRALKTVPSLEIELGMFLEKTVPMRVARPKPGQKKFVHVIRTEEKGSDVNLATRMLVDGFDDAYDCAVLITNDSDLLGPIRIVRAKLGKKVGLLNPQKRPSYALKSEVDFYKKIRQGPLSASQFPDLLNDIKGDFRKPIEW